jgi:hypothetical protein
VVMHFFSTPLLPRLQIGTVWGNQIGVSTSLSPSFQNISVRMVLWCQFASMVYSVPVGIFPAMQKSHSFLRGGPQRWITVRAAALAAGSGAQPRELSVQLIQHELLEQGAYLLSSIENCFDTQQPNSTSDVAVATGRCGV